MSLLYRYIGHDLQPHYLGIATMTQSFGVAVGPALSGLLLQFASWRILFLVNLPLVVLAAVCLVLGLFPDRLTALFRSLAAQML